MNPNQRMHRTLSPPVTPQAQAGGTPVGRQRFRGRRAGRVRKTGWVSLWAVALLSGCAVSDDPREGGLISYLVKGERAYEKRLERRQTLQRRVADDLDFQWQRAQMLEQQNAARQRELEERLAAIEELAEQLAVVENSAARSPQISLAIGRELTLQRHKLDRLRSASHDPRAAQEELDRLRAEVASLADRVRLLLETQ